MPAPLSIDLRIRILEARAKEGLTYDQLADRFAVGRATVHRILRLARETGSVEPAPHGGGPARLVTEAVQETLGELVHDQPDAILAELCTALAERTGVHVSRATMCRELHRLGFTRKKNPLWRRNSAGPRFRPSARRFLPRCRLATQNA